jgi:hypothetical protein
MDGWQARVDAMTRRHRRLRLTDAGPILLGLLVTVALAACAGSDDDSDARIAGAATDVGSTMTVDASASDGTSSSKSTSSVVTVSDGTIAAVVADWPSPSPARPVGWLLVDLAGSAIDGATQVVLQVRYDQVGCGLAGRPVWFDQLETGTELTFERGRARTRPPVVGGETMIWPSRTPISAVRVRIRCPAGTEDWAARVAAHRATWHAAGIDTYGFTLRYTTMFLHGVYEISVVDGAPVGAVRVTPEGKRDYLNVRELPKTIDEIFDQLERELAGDSFSAEFDEALGYPTHVCVDRLDNAVDDELEFFISDFVVNAPGRASDTSVTDVPQCLGDSG